MHLASQAGGAAGLVAGLLVLLLLLWSLSLSGGEKRAAPIGSPRLPIRELVYFDPGCGSPVDPAAAAAKRIVGGLPHYFCSLSCLRHYEMRTHRWRSVPARPTTSTPLASRLAQQASGPATGAKPWGIARALVPVSALLAR
jgi:YHS domain-containing protein